MNLQIIAAPLIGGIIGLITNGLAIKMLFRPYKEVRIGKFRVPFTPGLIPKEKKRIAAAVGKIVGNELLNGETLQKALCSEDMQNSYFKKYDKITEGLRTSDKLLKDYLQEKGFYDTIDSVKGGVSKKAGHFIADKLVEQNISMTLLDYAASEVMENLSPMIRTMAAGAVEAAKMPLSVKIDNMILEKCPDYIEGYIGTNYEEWMDKPMKEIIRHLEEKFPRLRYQIWIVYETFIEEKADTFIRKINIPKVVEDKINEFDVAELEKMIVEIARKELNALVWLGGLLGMLMGFVNLLF